MSTTLRFRSCSRKRKYFTDDAAEVAKALAERRSGKPFYVYRCQFCRARHLTHKRLSVQARGDIRGAARRQAEKGGGR